MRILSIRAEPLDMDHQLGVAIRYEGGIRQAFRMPMPRTTEQAAVMFAAIFGEMQDTWNAKRTLQTNLLKMK